MGNIVSVSDVTELQGLQLLLHLKYREEIGQGLTGMLPIG
jgi:hypothetical protein